MADTCQQILDSALFRGGLQSIYDSDDGVVTAIAFRELNLMLDIWSAEISPLFNVVDSQTGAPIPGFQLTPGTAAYNIGTAALLGVRPPSIATIYLLDNNNVSYYQRFIQADEFSRLIYKVAPGRPYLVYVNYQALTITLTFYPTPAYNDQVHVLYNEALTPFASTSTPVVFPPGFEDVFINNLAIRLCAMFGKTPPQWVTSAAAWGKNVVAANSESYYLLQTPMPTQKRRFFNILTGGTI
jgi:hypothetical protein